MIWNAGDLEDIAQPRPRTPTADELVARTTDLGHGVGVIAIRTDSSIPPRGTTIGRAVWREELDRWDVRDDRWRIRVWARSLVSAERIVRARVRATSRTEAARVR